MLKGKKYYYFFFVMEYCVNRIIIEIKKLTKFRFCHWAFQALHTKWMALYHHVQNTIMSEFYYVVFRISSVKNIYIYK